MCPTKQNCGRGKAGDGDAIATGAVMRHVMRMTARDTPIAVMWENFGPYHHDRARAMAAAGHRVHAIQLFGRSTDYDWEQAEQVPYPLVTLARGEETIGTLALARRLVAAVRQSGARECLFCHYEKPAVLLAATILAMRGVRVFTMVASKGDDYARRPWREALKRLWLKPYAGGIAGSERSRDYLAGLGLPRARSVTGYDTVDIARIRQQGDAATEPFFADRPFVIAARLVPKKNVAHALHALARARSLGIERRLRILGDGPLRRDLENEAARLGIAEHVVFEGHCSSAQVSVAMREGLALLLPSLSEQFGLVVNEALANALPVIVSRNAGAVDLLVDDGGNGIVIDPQDEQALVDAMRALDREVRWQPMRSAARDSAPRGDVRQFVEGVETLLAPPRQS